MATVEIRIAQQGPPRAIYSREAAQLLSHLGDIAIRRASRVEVLADLNPAARAAALAQVPGADPNSWWIDLQLVHGPVLGPFPDYTTAVETEVAWLKARGIPLHNFEERSDEPDHTTPSDTAQQPAPGSP